MEKREFLEAVDRESEIIRLNAEVVKLTGECDDMYDRLKASRSHAKRLLAALEEIVPLLEITHWSAALRIARVALRNRDAG
jgi:hypothetical protein